jgi:hypothetical protein
MLLNQVGAIRSGVSPRDHGCTEEAKWPIAESS